MHTIVTSSLRWIINLNPIVLCTDFISDIRSRYDFLQRNSLEGVLLPTEYLTIRQRYLVLVNPQHFPLHLPGIKYFVEFMNFSYNIGAYMFRGTDYLNHGFFEDIHQRRKGFAEYFENPSEATLWIATRNSFTFWLSHAKGRLGEHSPDYIFIRFFEKMANEGVRRALLDPDFDSGKIVSRDWRFMLDFWSKGMLRVYKRVPLFTAQEWQQIPLQYRKLISKELIATMDLDESTAEAWLAQPEAC